MCTNRQTLLYELTTSVTFLRGETGVHSNNCVPSSLSLFTQNVEEGAPTGVHDALCQGMILNHVENAQLLHLSLSASICTVVAGTCVLP